MRTTMNISLPEPLKQWVEKQVNQGGFSTASEYIRDVLRREQIVDLRSQIDRRLTGALNSGEPISYSSSAIRRKAQKNVSNNYNT